MNSKSFTIYSDTDINWIFQQNVIWLEDYFCLTSGLPDSLVIQTLVTTVKKQAGITLAELLQQVEGASRDDIYTLIATGQVYVNLNDTKLAEPEQVKVFLNREIACVYEQFLFVAPCPVTDETQPFRVTVGTSLLWDGQCWKVVNTGTTSTGLLHTNGRFIELPNAALEALINESKITQVNRRESPNLHPLIQEVLEQARLEDIAEAKRRYDILLPYLSGCSPAPSSSTVRRWHHQYRSAEALYGSGYIGLLPHATKGNYTAKVDESVREFMLQFIEEHYENSTQRRKWRVYEAFVNACEAHEPKLTPPSHTTFFQAIRQRTGVTQTYRREGHRAATQKAAFNWELKLTTPRHGSRPFEIVHIDHTQLDIELVSSLQSLDSCHFAVSHSGIQRNLGRPWVTFVVDAYSRRLIAVYLTFDEPSYRSCMMALRICIQRFQRFPQTIVVDNGPEFHSHYFEHLLAYYVCTKKHRPPAHARFGSVIERLFGTANTQFIHELQGNTQITRQLRQVTKVVNPRTLAIWTLNDLHTALCKWAYDIYDQREHPTLGLSPRDAFETGLAVGGSRLHRHVDYNEVFRMLTLPAPDRGKRKVQPGHGVKIHNIYYWSNAFRDPKVEQSTVEVRYDPFDASIAYALVQKQWVKCISTYYQALQGRSEKEIQLISAELKQRKRIYGQTRTMTDKELVEFLNSQQAKEGVFLEQRLRAVENQTVLLATQTVHGQSVTDSPPNPSSSSDASQSESPEATTEQLSNIELEAVVTETLEYYGEF